MFSHVVPFFQTIFALIYRLLFQNESPRSQQREDNRASLSLETLERRQLMAGDLGGNTFNQANDIGTDRDRTIQEYVGPRDTNDFYKFTLTRRSTVDAAMSGLGADIDLELYNANRSRLAWSTNGGARNESISRTLDAGTYFVRAYPYGAASSNYTLDLAIEAIAAVAPDHAGNSLAAARNIGTLRGAVTLNDFVSTSGDRDDYVRFTLAQTSDVAITMTGMTNDADMQLLNGSGTTIASSGNWGSNNESMSRQLAAGTYFVRVTAYQGSTNYSLRLQADAVVSTPPSKVAVQATATASNAVRLNWNDAANETEYRVWYWNNGWQKLDTLGANTTSYTATGLAANARHHFVIQSVNAAGITNSELTSTVTPAAVAQSTLAIPVNWWGGAYTTDNGFRNRGYAPARFGATYLGTSAGNCTWYVEGRIRQTANVTGINASRLNGLTGNANVWEARTSIFQATSTPQVGAVAQWDVGGYGHVAFVERVNANGSIEISESSYVPNPQSNPGANFEYRTRTIRPGATGGVFAAWPTRFLVVRA
ncbi:pre-peptidase C-terminal domain-containing protein [Aporhodopirellula aestuarii]|uniref:Pre-peptidase C-terminal domain-containing protein n=1 Tax=Aporhodopirellula aestuarii TaxID=2950107 RepID=A0ABT0UCT2_9BACT|nr:pre-peptidase C-terminal domain-containing protein [Aporhodopirellula aestuarii]MCM2374656.1 pre-peptidase C-terminal domain-containing protein [Aporhodopirellula aestuarii]